MPSKQRQSGLACCGSRGGGGSVVIGGGGSDTSKTTSKSSPATDGANGSGAHTVTTTTHNDSSAATTSATITAKGISATAPDGTALPAGWMTKRATSGNQEPYYVNVTTGISQWERPTAADDPVRQVFDRADGGSKGYLDKADVQRLVVSIGYECTDGELAKKR